MIAWAFAGVFITVNSQTKACEQMAELGRSEDSTQATVYFDGACPVCSREVGLYRRLDRSCSIKWHDVSVDTGDLAKDGVDQTEALARLHARMPNGQLAIGVDAFVTIWERVPLFKPLALLARLTPVRWLLERGYSWYAPRRKRLTERGLFSRQEAR